MIDSRPSPPTPTRLDIPKAAQIAALFLKASGDRPMPYIRLLKLMYVLERESLKERGRPVIGDRVAAMQHGPVLSGVYDLCKGGLGVDEWDKCIATNRFVVELQSEPEFDRVSDWEVRKVYEVTARYAALNRWELIDHLHETLPEWQAHQPGHGTPKSIEIPLAEILAAVGRTDGEEIQDDIAARESLRQLLGDS